MKNDITELVFILDRSGSMHGLESDTIGGFNSMLDKQRKVEGTAFVTTVLFSDFISTVHDRLEIKAVPEMTDRDYVTGGSTALIDAIGTTIDHIAVIHRYARPEDVPEKTMFVIITDGMENSSHIYSADKVRAMVEDKKKRGWEFIFLGANIDAAETARGFGIAGDRAVNFVSDKTGHAVNFRTVDKAIRSVRQGAALDPSWKKEIDDDYNARKIEKPRPVRKNK